VFVKFNHEKGGRKLDFKIIVNFVHGSQLLESLVGEAEHVTLFIKFSKQYSWCVFCLVWYDFFVASGLEVVTGRKMRSLVERCAAVNQRLEIFHI
jgi:hypothetical protein